ncbi:aldehyde dehydrogenase family protein [Candidatus Poribacteria bacterium]|nr:aldehyde dehydrogenase family protein [Candidatus Poribacteria bacterium]
MSYQPVMIDGVWQQAYEPVDYFVATNPYTRESLSDCFPVSTFADVDLALKAAQKAVMELRTISPDVIACFLEKYAEFIEERADELVESAHIETGLPEEPRLRSVELPRTTDQLRQAAHAARDRSWCHATIDTKMNIRSKYSSIGPVAIFGPNNFPFAFNSIAGGDFASAIAAGNPVIAKANTGHPRTTKILGEASFEAVKAVGLPDGMVQLLYRLKPKDGFKFVSHPMLGATGFTGSKKAGLQLKEAADKAGKPIYLEMSSINPVFMLPGALEERYREICVEFFNSCSLGAGQFCTNPGLVIMINGKTSEKFIDEVAALFRETPEEVLLGAEGTAGIDRAIHIMQQHGAELITGGKELQGNGYSYENTLLRVPGDMFIKNPHELQTEAFGTVSLMVIARDLDQMLSITNKLEGNLTGCIYSHTQGEDDKFYNRLEPLLRAKVGRLLNDKMPTGVAVTPAMNHGGPYPATGHPGFTSVGIPASMLRFAVLQCYDNVRQHRLPPELQNKNPTGKMWRFVAGKWTQADIIHKG